MAAVKSAAAETGKGAGAGAGAGAGTDAPPSGKEAVAAALAAAAEAGDETAEMRGKADEIWRMLDDMAAKDPEAYQQFIKAQMEGALGEKRRTEGGEEPKGAGQQQGGAAAQAAARAPPPARRLSTKRPALVFEAPIRASNALAHLAIWVSDGGVNAPELPTARAPAVAWDEVAVQVAVRAAPRESGGVHVFELDAHEKALAVALDDAHVGCAAVRTNLAHAAALMVERSFGAPLDLQGLRYVAASGVPIRPQSMTMVKSHSEGLGRPCSMAS